MEEETSLAQDLHERIRELNAQCANIDTPTLRTDVCNDTAEFSPLLSAVLFTNDELEPSVLTWMDLVHFRRLLLSLLTYPSTSPDDQHELTQAIRDLRDLALNLGYATQVENDVLPDSEKLIGYNEINDELVDSFSQGDRIYMDTTGERPFKFIRRPRCSSTIDEWLHFDNINPWTTQASALLELATLYDNLIGGEYDEEEPELGIIEVDPRYDDEVFAEYYATQNGDIQP